jgi:integrase
LEYAHRALNGYMGDWTLDRINKSACTNYRDYRLQTVASRPIRIGLEALRAALHWGLPEEGGRVVKQMPDLKLPLKGDDRPRWLTSQEADRLRTACVAKHLRLFVEIGLHTGARSGVILDRVDWDDRTVDFQVPDRLITNKRNVAQPINDDLYAVLLAAKQRATCDFVIERAGDKVEAIKQGFHRACERAGLAGVTPHTLRPTVVTRTLHNGVPIWEAFAGMTVKMIEAAYGHAIAGSKRGAAKALERTSQRTAATASGKTPRLPAVVPAAGAFGRTPGLPAVVQAACASSRTPGFVPSFLRWRCRAF